MNKRDLIRIARNHQGDFRLFIDELGLPQDFKVEIAVGDISEFPDTRNVAYTMKMSPRHFKMVFAPKWDELTDNNYIAVLRHEYGHVLHLMHPNIFAYYRKQGVNIYPKHEEIFSDFIGSTVWAEHIYYDENLIQTLDQTPIDIRPRHLGW